METNYSIQPICDNGLAISFGDSISPQINDKVMALFHYLQLSPLSGQTDLVPAYNSLTVFYDLVAARQQLKKEENVSALLSKEITNVIRSLSIAGNKPNRSLRIPVCYETSFAPDIREVSTLHGLTPGELIEIHTSEAYRVYMLGFLPGFAYMGALSENIATPRKPTPAQNIPAGSVGIAGRQTGIYPLNSPGGWQIIGRTPLKIFDPGKENPTLFQPGDEVTFYSISSSTFYEMKEA